MSGYGTSRQPWTATVNYLDGGRYWRGLPAFTVYGSSLAMASANAMRDLKQRLPKGTRIPEVKLHLVRQPKVTESPS